jgi:hypothetical protein
VFTDLLFRNGLHNTTVFSTIAKQRLYTLQYYGSAAEQGIPTSECMYASDKDFYALGNIVVVY